MTTIRRKAKRELNKSLWRPPLHSMRCLELKKLPLKSKLKRLTANLRYFSIQTNVLTIQTQTTTFKNSTKHTRFFLMRKSGLAMTSTEMTEMAMHLRQMNGWMRTIFIGICTLKFLNRTTNRLLSDTVAQKTRSKIWLSFMRSSAEKSQKF